MPHLSKMIVDCIAVIMIQMKVWLQENGMNSREAKCFEKKRNPGPGQNTIFPELPLTLYDLRGPGCLQYPASPTPFQGCLRSWRMSVKPWRSRVYLTHISGV
jgi:hypothetical protein